MKKKEKDITPKKKNREKYSEKKYIKGQVIDIIV